MATASSLMARLAKLEAVRTAEQTSTQRRLIRFVDPQPGGGGPAISKELRALSQSAYKSNPATVLRDPGESEEAFIERAFTEVGDGLLIEA